MYTTRSLGMSSLLHVPIIFFLGKTFVINSVTLTLLVVYFLALKCYRKHFPRLRVIFEVFCSRFFLFFSQLLCVIAHGLILLLPFLKW